MTIQDAARLQPPGKEPGIYFGLPEHEYRNDPAISRSEIVDLLELPQKYWLKSWMNPRRKPMRATDSMKRGKAFHTLLLEGEEKFFQEYFLLPCATWPKGKVDIREPDYEVMQERVKTLRSVPKLNQIFSYGYPEVSMFWQDPDTGLMLKCRHDYLKYFGSADYKTTERTPSDREIGNATTNYGLDIQNALYIEGTRTLRKQLKEGTAYAYGDVSDEFLTDFMDYDYETRGEEFYFIWQELKYPYSVNWKLMDYEVLQEAFADLRMGLGLYLSSLHKWGTTEPWAGAVDCDTDFLTTRHVRRRR